MEADGNYIKLNTTDSTFITLMKLSKMEEKLQAHKHFVRFTNRLLYLRFT